MKKKTIQFKLSKFKYLLFLPILLFSFCESNFEEISFGSENKLTKDAMVLSLMKSAVRSDLNKTSSKSAGTAEEDQCTHFLYPMTFEVYSGDDPTPQLMEITSDEELISFIDTLIASTTNYEFYIFFPITLLDTDGVETVLTDLNELEGTLQMAVDACASFTDDSSEDNDEDDSSNNDSADNDSNDGSDDGSNDGSDDVNNNEDDNESDDGSDDGLDDVNNNESDDDSDNQAGIHNAHFDVDTSHLVYDFNDGKTDAHTHRYDEKYDTNIVDYFNILNDDKKKKKGLRNINDIEFGVPNDSEQFYIIIGNANLSQDVQLEINGNLISVMDYQAKVDAYLNGNSNALEVYSLGESKDATQLTSLKFIVGLDAANVKNGLIPTETSTVVGNTKGPNGEYRDGALIAQAININSMSLNSSLGVADENAGLYWESTIFWHVKKDKQNNRDDKNNNDSDDHCGKKNKKVYICHKGKTICVSVNAIWGHMQHHEDDYLGRCDD